MLKDFSKLRRFIKDNKLIITTSQGIYIKTIYKYKNLNTKHYPLEADVKTGSYLTSAGKVEVLTKEKWLQRKKIYEQILKKSNY